MNYYNKKILTKLGYPAIDLHINEDAINFLREDARDDFGNILYHLNKNCSVRVFLSIREKNIWIENYTIALVKTFVGRTIGRFNKEEYDIDYEAVLKIGMDEKQKLTDKLLKFSKVNRRLLIERTR